MRTFTKMMIGMAALIATATTLASAEALLLPTNGGFETDTFTGGVGYISQNTPITGWTTAQTTQVGLNPVWTDGARTAVANQFFANSGIIPEGDQAAFLQSNASTTTFSQDVNGFTVGDRYITVYRESMRAGFAVPTVSVDLGGDIGHVAAHGATAVGGGNAYETRFGSTFTASALVHTLTFNSTTGADGAAAIDRVELAHYGATEGIVLNRSFEWDSFPSGNGYSTDGSNGDISGWTSTHLNRTGINPSAASPFANNGTIPDGSQAAFIQAAGGETPTLSTTVTGLEIGKTYQIDMSLNARNGQAPKAIITSGASTLMQSQIVSSVGGVNPYRAATFYYTATATTATFSVQNVAGGDNTLLLDNVSYQQVDTPAWTADAWTGDATSGITTGGTYTHAYNLGGTGAGQTPATTINGVDFASAAGTFPSNNAGQPGGDFTLGGYSNAFGAHGNNVSAGADGSADIANSFVFGGLPGTLTLTGLVAGSTNVLTLYGVGFDAVEGRTASFTSASGERITVDENALGNGNGTRIQYAYTVNADGVATIDIAPLGDRSFHLYGFANEATSAITDLFNTGVDGSGNPQGDNSADSHWTIVSTPSGPSAIAGVVTTSAGGFPIGPWLGDNSDSAWITPSNDTNGLPGSYTYETTFTLPDGFNIAEIVGRFAVDNDVTDVVLNGNSLGISGSGFNAWTDFVIDTGFIEGLNTLQFLVSNGAPTGPTGLRVEFNSAIAGFVPTPGALPAGLAMLAVIGTRRRRR